MAQRFSRGDGHLAVTIDRHDLAWERTPPAKKTAERSTPVGRADDRVGVRVTLDTISLAFTLVEEGRERGPSELLLVAFLRHRRSGESVTPASSSQSRTAVARPASGPAGSADEFVPASRERLYLVDAVSASRE